MLDWKGIRRKYSSKSKVFSFEMLIYAALLKAAAHCRFFVVELQIFFGGDKSGYHQPAAY